jgi:hypothetical protein
VPVSALSTRLYVLLCLHSELTCWHAIYLVIHLLFYSYHFTIELFNFSSACRQIFVSERIKQYVSWHERWYFESILKVFKLVTFLCTFYRCNLNYFCSHFKLSMNRLLMFNSYSSSTKFTLQDAMFLILMLKFSLNTPSKNKSYSNISH